MKGEEAAAVGNAVKCWCLLFVGDGKAEKGAELALLKIRQEPNEENHNPESSIHRENNDAFFGKSHHFC